MKKSFILVLALLIGIGISSIGYADSTRTIALKSKSVLSANTLVSANGIDVYKIIGVANSANAVWVAYNVAAITDATNGTTAPNQNIMAEGGEATQYDGIYVDFGPEGLRFSTGMVVVTSTANLTVLYR